MALPLLVGHGLRNYLILIMMDDADNDDVDDVEFGDSAIALFYV